MKEIVVRLENISISNFKNVVDGSLSFTNPNKSYAASILGLYGQNGSGKTALIDSIALLKCALCGRTIPVQFSDYINIDAGFATLKYGFKVMDKESEAEYDVSYELSIKRDIDDTVENTDDSATDTISEKYKTTVFDEVLSYSYKSNTDKQNNLSVIDTRTDNVFIPSTKFDILTGKDKTVVTDLLVAKKLATATSRSFVFSKELLSVIRDKCEEKWRIVLMNALVNYGNYELFVINTINSGLISMDALPLAFKYEEKNKGTIGNIPIPLNGSAIIPQEAMDVVNKVIDDMNIVLAQMIPGLTISIKDLGIQVMKSGKVGCKIQVMSHKNSKEIPLKYESEGIKKIVSVLQLLIVVYNKPSITVAVDELDSGIFEYLLGEILRIISEKGKGQLIFTSHNLRPLETLDRGFIAFTTTNPSKRYIRFSNVKKTNNLRDFYYRDITLGEQSEAVYEPTNNYEIALAFREAGDYSGS